MSLPNAASEMVGNLTLGSEMGLSAGTVLATASPKDLTALVSNVPETYVLLVRLSSGNATVAVDVAATGAYGSADATTGAISDTVGRYLTFDTAVATPYVNVRITTSANAIIDRFAVLSLCKLAAGEVNHSVHNGKNACLASAGDPDGSGVFTFSVSA